MSRIRSRDSRNLFFHKGGWWIDIQINGKRYREFAGRTESQARLYRDRLKAWKRDERNGLPAARPEGVPVTFAKQADNYLALCAKLKRSYRRDLISVGHLKAFFKGKLLKDVNSEGVARYRASRANATVLRRTSDGKREKRPLSTGTINREMACLRTILRKAVEWGKLSSYPLPREKFLSREREFKPRIFEPDEAARLISVAEPRWLKPAIIIWLNTGLRKMELLKLRRDDVKSVKVRKGNVESIDWYLTVRAENAKNGKERTLPISEVVVQALSGMPGERYFFENPNTKRHIWDLLRRFKAAAKAAGITGPVRIHDLRDTFATMALRGGIDIRTVAELIGDTPEVALKRYCHSDDKTKRAAMDKISGFVIGSLPEVHEEPIDDVKPASESIS